MKNQKQILNKKGLTEQVKKIHSAHYQEKFVTPGPELAIETRALSPRNTLHDKNFLVCSRTPATRHQC